ncbi:MAG: hypothetical protein A2428_14665 [Bdellovibrionales bacterium RIFOXYC1_FULL_54_43]|nr:MAG: hypothetical protein A2428_14665 [Bdellovibrionales bacterium RIFOXYC1_FULL_54_43]OFZ82520.1 MAG: hypothetical protein A2603_15480 [Bdellovibrionales bacterium RIFOXYD1_FULL_55_31]
MNSRIKGGLAKVGGGLVKLTIGLAVFLAIGIVMIIIGDRRSAGQSEALRARITAEMSWADVAAQIEAEPNWHMISFGSSSLDCGWVSGGGGPTRNRPGHYSLVADHKRSPINNLTDPDVVARVKRCHKVLVAFHPKFSFSKVDFTILFDANGNVMSTTQTRVWD